MRVRERERVLRAYPSHVSALETLHRRIGNRAAGLLVQTKPQIGPSRDRCEEEADRVAEQGATKPKHPDVSTALPRIQRHAGQPVGQAAAVPADVAQALGGPGRPLDQALRQAMEQRLGHSFARVRVHSGAVAEQSARAINANAYTAGHNIVFGSGQFAPESPEGRRLIAHELTKVVQQSGAHGAQGTSAPPVQRQSNRREAGPRQATVEVRWSGAG